jgi:hypothetical protein
MTAIHNTFKGMLWTHHLDMPGLSDEFIAEGFRVRLMGQILDVSFEALVTSSEGSATSLAEKYVRTSGKCLAMPITMMTEAEWLQRTAPPFGKMTTSYSGREGRDHAMEAIRKARNELLISDDMTLRRCYDYLQDAQERMYAGNDGVVFDAYNALEVLEVKFGNEREAVAILGQLFRKAKKAANTEGRHIPEKFRRPSDGSGGAMELTRQVIRKYEQYLLHLL